MRTVPFKRVFDKAIRWKGLNPYKDVPPYEREAMVDRINDRVRQVLKGWIWPEWTVTEQRAFRQVWNEDHRYLRVSTNGKPDEVFYIETLSYYQVISDLDDDPPTGTLPTDTDWWLPMDSGDVGTYIAYDQGCRRSIGTINGVFQSNPSGCSCDQAGRLKYHPSQNGLEICATSGPTVFIDYQMPVPSYTMVPYADGRMYQRADVVFDPGSGECFQALVPTTNPPTTTDWGRVPFLEKWENFVVFGAYADALSESDNENNVDVQQRQLLAMKAEGKAADAFQTEVDELTYQGQVLQWSPCKRNGYWCETIAWSGADVVELDEDCQDALGWVFPGPPAQAPGGGGGGSFHCPAPGECPNLAYISEPNVFENVNTLPGLRVEAKEVNTDYTLTSIDFNLLVDATSGIINIFLPLALGSGQLFHITKIDVSDNPVIITPESGDMIDGEPNSVLGSQYSDVTIIDGALAYWDKLGLGVGDVPTALSDFARKSVSNVFQDLNTFTGVRFATKVITADDSPYTFDLLDFTLLADASFGPITILLPAATGTGQLYHVKKIDGTGGVVTIQRNGTDTIDGSVSVNFVEQWGSALLQDATTGYWDNIGSEILLDSGGGGGTIELPLLLDKLRILADGTLQIFNQTQGKFHTISIGGTAGAEYITISAGVT